MHFESYWTRSKGNSTLLHPRLFQTSDKQGNNLVGAVAEEIIHVNHPALRPVRNRTSCKRVRQPIAVPIDH